MMKSRPLFKLAILLIFHALLLQFFHPFSSSSYGYPSGNISILSDQTRKATHLKTKLKYYQDKNVNLKIFTGEITNCYT
jgi:hypothetical protein